MSDPAWGSALPCCALCGRPLDAGRARWVVTDEGIGFNVCPSVEDCPPLRAMVRECPERFTNGVTWPSGDRPVRLWPAVVRSIEQTSGFDYTFGWRLELAVTVADRHGRPRVRSFRYLLPRRWDDPLARRVAETVLGRVPAPEDLADPAEWGGKRCAAVLDWCRDHNGRQVAWVTEIRPPLVSGSGPSRR